MSDTDTLLAERQTTHGDYSEQAIVTQGLKDVMHASLNWMVLNEPQKETLHMIANKIGRVLSGDPNFLDHWDDIAGYATLVGNNLRNNPTE
jgi:hypothetical protein